MKKLHLIALLLLFSTFSFSSMRTVNVVVTKTAVPEGFNKSERIQFAVFGVLASSCYRVGPYALKIDTAQKIIHLQQQAYYSTGKLCTQTFLPYSQIINVGELDGGNYRIFDHHSDKLIGELYIDNNIKTLPENKYYAPVTGLTISTVRANNPPIHQLTLAGVHANSCLHFDGLVVDYQSNTIFITPTIRAEGITCREVKTPFTKTIDLKEGLKGTYLLHVRTFNGLGLNKIIVFD